MHVVEVKNWEEFEERLHDLTAQRSTLRGEITPPISTYVSPFLFRGQSNVAWNLTTTLERYFPRRISVRDYYNKVFAAKSQIETFTGLRWDIPVPSDYSKWLEKQSSLAFGLLEYEYLAYLRHHAFPSPLLNQPT